MTVYHKYDRIAPAIRAMVMRVKYGSARSTDLVRLLRKEADAIEREDALAKEVQKQESLHYGNLPD